MDYSLEELLPIVARLSERYTRKESSSVTYETAEMLMEAVLTCVREGMENGERAVAGGEKPKAEQIYQRGRERIEEKAQKAKRIYEELMTGWEDYGCLNYRDTVRTGMMEFFARYDAQFQPQNHLLTLDYPLLCPLPKQCGADLILGYLKRVRIEKAFLDCFRREPVIRLMDRVSPDGRKNYMGNLCEPVLLAACGCMIADQPVGELMLNSMRRDGWLFGTGSPRICHADFQWNSVGLPGRRVLYAGISDGLTESKREGKPDGRWGRIFVT